MQYLATPCKINGWNTIMEVDGRWCSFSKGWLSGSLLIFRGCLSQKFGWQREKQKFCAPCMPIIIWVKSRFLSHGLKKIIKSYIKQLSQKKAPSTNGFLFLSCCPYDKSGEMPSLYTTSIWSSWSRHTNHDWTKFMVYYGCLLQTPPFLLEEIHLS